MIIIIICSLLFVLTVFFMSILAKRKTDDITDDFINFPEKEQQYINNYFKYLEKASHSYKIK